jgi:hypothetical protein
LCVDAGAALAELDQIKGLVLLPQGSAKRQRCGAKDGNSGGQKLPLGLELGERSQPFVARR